jgi:glycerophosphoryl diester phosphodiesterase
MESPMPTNNDPFYIVGHRGAAGERFENSLDGFKHTLTLGIDAIELDIREHSSRLWVFHDSDLERLTGKAGCFDDQPDPAQIQLLNGEPVPDLRQVLDLYWNKMPVNIEIKSVANPKLLLDLLEQYPTPDVSSDILADDSPGLPWILISSFDHTVLLELKDLGCPWPLAPISHRIPLQLDAELNHIGAFTWHFDDKYLDLEQVRYLRDRGLAAMVFTVNDLERAQFLKRNGVAGIFTDFPTRMLELRR